MMAFRFEPTIGSVLREQATETRVLQSARTLGSSSITKGDGSLDLLATDSSEAPTASYGDLPGGDFGVGAVIDGTMENLATYSRTLKGRVDGHDTTLASHDTRITTAQNRADKGVADAAKAQARADKGVADAAKAQARADKAVSDAAAAQSTANGAVSVNNTQNNRLGTLEGKVSALEGAPSGPSQSAFNALRDRVAQLESDMAAVKSALGIIGA